MIERDQLIVWHKDRIVGTIFRESNGKMAFLYHPDWIKKGFPLSIKLPLTSDYYDEENSDAHSYFANLLPEGNARIALVQSFGTPDQDFDLLKITGVESAGAFTILTPEKKPDLSISYTPMPFELLQKLVENKGAFYNSQARSLNLRLSLAGAQNKYPLYKKEGLLFIPNGNSPSSHILKFEIPNFKNVPIYETALNQLAHAIRLKVPKIELNKLDNKNYFLLIERYDREFMNDGTLQRLHQEDFCQALGYPAYKKYESDGGPSFKECYLFVKKISSNPIIDTEYLLRWLIFNFICGNSDGHAKNISILYLLDGSIRLSPFYDLVSTRALAGLDDKLAMSIGNEYHPEKVSLKNWDCLANDCGISTKYLYQLLKNMIEKINISFDQMQDTSNLPYGPHPCLQRVKAIIIKQSKKLLRELSDL